LSSSATHPAQVHSTGDGPSRVAVDPLAIEQREDDGMIVHQGAALNLHISKDFNAITAR
jgi:hypothetical protein